MRPRDHQADHVLRAYRYQLLHALLEWIDLRPDQELLLEIDEDHAVVSAQRSDSTQVKFSGAVVARSISLRSTGIIQAISRYWEQSRGGEDPRANLRFLTNSTAAREQGATFSDGRGALAYWRDVAREGDLTPLRMILSEVFEGTALGNWLQTAPSDDDVRSRLLKRVDFVVGAPDDAALRSYIRDRLGMLYLVKGHYETTADLALPMLLERVLDAASSPDIKARRLTIGDLHRALEQALPRMGALVQGQLGQVRPETGVGVTPLQLRSGLCDRSATVAGMVGRAGQRPLVWLYGANGVGKSTLAKLIATSHGGSWLVCDFRPFQSDADSRGAVALWRELMSAMASGPKLEGIILDDIGSRGVDMLRSRLAGLAAATRITGANVIITSNHTPSTALLAELGAPPQAALEAPYFRWPRFVYLSSNPLRRRPP